MFDLEFIEILYNQLAIIMEYSYFKPVTSLDVFQHVLKTRKKVLFTSAHQVIHEVHPTCETNEVKHVVFTT